MNIARSGGYDKPKLSMVLLLIVNCSSSLQDNSDVSHEGEPLFSPVKPITEKQQGKDAPYGRC